MLPEQVTLAGLRLETEDAPRQMIVMLKGYAASNADLMEFQRKLAAAPAFEAVTVSESKAS
ncbi:MAG: PilN domain-containing protein, partial [bacterium]